MLIIVILGALGLLLVIGSDFVYRKLAYDHRRDALTELIKLKESDLYTQLVSYAVAAGSRWQREPKLRTSIKIRDIETIQPIISDKFRSYFITTGLINLKSIYVYDEKFTILLANTELMQLQTSPDHPQICPSLIKRAKKREGNDQLKAIHQLCKYNELPYFSIIIMVGKFHPIGYLQLVIDPIYTFSKLEKELGLPIDITLPNGHSLFRSMAWASTIKKQDSHIVASYKTYRNNAHLFTINMVENLEGFNTQLKQTKYMVIISATFIIALAILGALIIIRKATKPLYKLQMSAEKITASVELASDFLISTRGIIHPEIRHLVRAFNAMINSIWEHQDNLADMHIKLQNALNELQSHKDQLEEKVTERTNQLSEKNRQLNSANEEVNITMKSLKDTQEALLQTEKLAVAGQLSGIIAHEVLNPITAISLRVRTDISKDREFIKVIDTCNGIIQEWQTQNNNSSIDTYLQTNGRADLNLMEKIGYALTKTHQDKLSDLEFIDRQINRIIKIIDGFRELSRQKKHIETINLEKVINEVCDDFGDRFSKSAIILALDLVCVVDIKADHMEIYSIISNLLRNAIQAIECNTNQEKKTIAIKLSATATQLEMLISDSGCGILPDKWEAIFEPGFTNKGRKGTGLGISFSRKIARSYHGDVEIVQSTIGEGTTFRTLLAIPQ